ncbi:putative acyltransferase [Pseudoruegeria aquimaris]|uniref:Putative acyltransferase n=1 Tax=Pseudoruegeria aquimaris TaxID=393663 RepID=A0A1Y5SRW2_9RHOB|nr:GNAT family N-acetyltransferase [Pseudoruegeria aquimaris]SLN43813.1 putative acyltransferase [Pseudoruegeria aquimaris]
MRHATAADHAALGQVMFAAIHAQGSPYSAAQCAAWLPAPPHGPEWETRLAAQIVLLEDGPEGPQGFVSLTRAGYVDLAFILPQARGTGLFRRLMEGLEREAGRQGITRLTTHASLAAEGPFLALGFTATARERITRADQALERCAMEKRLSAG